MASGGHDEGPTRTRVRLYGKRASYELEAARAIFALAPVAHVAFVHRETAVNGHGLNGCEASTLLNIPLITVLLPVDDSSADEVDELDSWAVYFHTSVSPSPPPAVLDHRSRYKRASLVEAVRQGTTITATTIISELPPHPLAT